jgi:hypothetical protein
MANGFLADLIFESWIDMSTVVVRVYTPEGFVVGADGRNYNAETKTILSDSIQKIFPIQHVGGVLAYSLSGTSELTPPGSNEILFDLLPWIHKQIIDLSTVKFRSLWHYGHAISESLSELPKEAAACVVGNEQPTLIFLDGYYDRRAKRVHIKFFYDGQPPEISVDEIPIGRPLGVGSQRVYEVLRDKDGPLKHYRVTALKLPEEERNTLPKAIEAALACISAQCSPEAKEIDDRCVSMGGRILLATLTRQDGFGWVEGYRP